MKIPVTIVVPVYGDWPSLSECITSLKECVDTKVHNVMLINDCGPEAGIIEKNIKKEIKGSTGFTYFKNPSNLGFIGNCNRAVLELDQTDNDILLLNSDTKVTPGFLEEMRIILYASDKNGAVSPRSNNATIATIPLSAASQKGIGPEQSYALYKKLKSYFPKYYEVPVAHGFCMLIRRSLIKQYGLFDTAFGKGYGEEVDFCMRIANHDYKCLLANHAYVFHLEARSFSLETKAKLLEENNKILWKRYPNFRQQVRDYMELAIPRENQLELDAGVKHRQGIRRTLKQIVKRNRLLHKTAVRLHGTLKPKR